MIRRLAVTCVAVAFASAAALAQQRSVDRVAGDVYRFQNQFHYSVFVITSEGVVVTDSINAEAASWLRAEIAKLAGQPITHLVCSHSHRDHASGALPYRDFPGTDVDAFIDQVRKAEALEFEILAGGHGPVGEKVDVSRAREYLEALRAELLAGLLAGKSTDDLVESVTMPAYAEWGAYDRWRALNVRGTARHLMATGAAD